MVVSPETGGNSSPQRGSTTASYINNKDSSPSVPKAPKVTFGIGSSSTGLPGGDMSMMQGKNKNILASSQSTASTSSSQTHSDTPVMLALPAPPHQSDDLEIDESSPSPIDENGHKYVGLVNQAMTCYLNSLVQSLYMTPEFRNAMYEWEYNSNGKSNSELSIPCQVQKLFLLLQTTDRDALETKDLTQSFGWNSNEAYDQHDVQELCRLMFDALELKWKGTNHEKLIENLYKGTMQDFVKCLKCGKENVRPDAFLDLPLAVKPFGAMEAFKSIEEALNAFIAPELLDGSNQYHCESCNSKQDAHKGLRVLTFPYLLTIQLKRFDFDYNTMHRIKLNDKMTFPDVLNLNPFVHDEKAVNIEIDESKENMMEVDAPSPALVGQMIDMDQVQQYLSQGEFVYELFSVMVHQGSAAGGHYFAYIKNMDLGKWYCFNDTRVEIATPSEISKSFGGTYGGWTGSNTNAYMLMYRKMDSKRNSKFLRTSQLPPHITNLKQKWKMMEDEKERMKIMQQNLVKVNVLLNMPCESEALLTQRILLEIDKSKTLQDLMNQALREFAERARPLGIILSKNKARLIKASTDLCRMVQEYVSKNHLDRKIESILPDPTLPAHSILNELNFILDVRDKSSISFPIASEGQGQMNRTILVSRVDIAARAVRHPFMLNLTNQSKEVLKLKLLIGSVYAEGQRASISSRLVIEKTKNLYQEELCLLEAPNLNVLDHMAASYSKTPVFYYDGGCDEHEENSVTGLDRKKPFEESQMCEILYRKKNAQIIKIVFPTEDEMSRAASVCGAYSGPTWNETMGMTSPEQHPHTPLTSSNLAQALFAHASPSTPNRSKGGSPVSSLAGSDIMLASGSGSFCNNTPQMSPNVSDSGAEVDDDDIRICDDFCNNAPVLTCEPPPSIGGSSTTVVASTGDCSQKIIKLRTEGSSHTLDVDSRISIGQLKIWIGEQLSMDPAQFAIVKHHNDDPSDKGFESSAKDDESISSAFPTGSVNRLSILLRAPLKDDEKLIKIIHFDLEEPNKENWRTLFECPASRQTLIGDILLRCQRLYEDIYGRTLEINQIRLREYVPMSTAIRPVLRLNQSLDSRGATWSNNIYLQIISDERIRGQPGEPIFLRRFRPSTVEVSPIHEALVDPNAENQLDSLKQSISQLSGIPVDRIVLTEPSRWGQWPYTKSRLSLLEENTPFHANSSSYSYNDLIEKIGTQVLYYKDSQEKPKDLSDEERKQITIKDNGSNTTINRRKERPLRIQMSSICEP